MLIGLRQLKSGLKTMNSLATKLKTENDADDFKKSENYNALKNAYLKILCASHELIHLKYNEIQEIKNFHNARNFTRRMFDMISDSKTALDFVQYIRSTFESINVSSEDDTVWTHDFDIDWRLSIFNPSLCKFDAEKIAKIIKASDDRKIKVLDTNCGSGENLCNLNEFLQINNLDTETFAVCYSQQLEYGTDIILLRRLKKQKLSNKRRFHKKQFFVQK